MKNDKLDNYISGWIVGNFCPTLVNRSDIEISIKTFHQYEYSGFFYRRRDTEYVIVIEGCIVSNGVKYGKGDILVISPSEIIDLFPIVETVCALIKTPGGKTDKVYDRPISLNIIEDICNFVFNELITDKLPSKKQVIESRINKKDITVLVQGPISKSFTESGLKSIRKYLPESKIVLSTWEGSDVSNLDYDKIVISKDPGGVVVPFWNGDSLSNNTNRYLVSTLAGLNEVDTKFVLKLRSDMYVLGDDFLNFFDKYPKRKEEFSLFKHRIIVPEIYTRKYLEYQCGEKKHRIECPFHITDWAMFGLKEDIDLWLSHVPFSDEENVMDKYTKECIYPSGWDLPPEQFYFIEALKTKYHNIHMKDVFDYDDKLVRLATEYTMNNFIILNTMKMKLFCGKYPHEFLINNGKSYATNGLMKNSDFEEYYKNIGLVELSDKK